MSTQLAVIAIVGMPGAGKSTAADFFRSEGASILRFGDQVDIGLKEHNLERNEKNERWYREKLRSELGMAAMAIKIEPRIQDAAKTSSFIVLDGLYSWEEYIYLRGKIPDIKLLCIYARPLLRYQRLSRRPVRPLTVEEARGRDIAELEKLNKGGPIAIADYLIQNNTNEDYFLKTLEEYYRKELLK